MYYYSIKKSFLISILSVISFLGQAQEDDLLKELDNLNQNEPDLNYLLLKPFKLEIYNQQKWLIKGICTW